MCRFCHLHLHTQYSLLDGANKIPEFIQRAHNLGQPAVAMTDHGNLHGAIEFYTEAKKIGIKPIIGCELYVTPGSRFDKVPARKGGEGIYHLTAMAKNMTGYQNLCRLVSLGYKEGFYFKPRVDHQILKEYSEGLVILSGCLAGELGEAAAELKNEQLFFERLNKYREIFKENFYLEVQPHAIAEQWSLNDMCVHAGKKLGIPIVATTDCHYGTADDHFAQEVLMCISTGKNITDPTRIQHIGVKLHLKTEDEMRTEFESGGAGDWLPEALSKSGEIAETCELEFNFKTHYMPRYRLGEDAASELNDEDLLSLMTKHAREGLTTRLLKVKQTEELTKKYWARLEEEVRLIGKMGFSGYFLVVADFIVWAKENGVPVGPGRGSAAGSLVAWALRITEVDPIPYDLLFERFLNPERVSLPDIDVDFCIQGRDRVLQYVVKKYGADRVAQIATFGTLKAKAAVKDVGRALGMSFAETDRIAQLIPAPRQGFDFSLAESIKMEPKLQAYADGEGKQLIELALKLEGLTRHSSTHAAGVVIGDRPLIDLLPMMLDKEDHDVTQYSMSYVEKVGLVKFDFLGLKTLTVIATAMTIIEEAHGVKVEINDIPLDDPGVFKLIATGNTTGIFQLESSGITEMCMRLKPNHFNDLVAILALYRPGPLDAGMVDHYINRKHGKEPVSYLHPLMEGSLKTTYGIMLYQEQIMRLARELAGYSLAEADILRKAMGKKNPVEMAKQRSFFTEGAAKNKVPEKLADEIFGQMETFARYGFNKSHSVAYALVSYQTAWLKSNYPVEFMAALMSHEIDDTDKVLKNMTECRKQKIIILPPDVNESIAGFSVRNRAIRYGLEALKGVGGKAVEAIIVARQIATDKNVGEESAGGPFKDHFDFVNRVDAGALNRRVLESLVKSGAFDFSGRPRSQMFDEIEEALKFAQSRAKVVDTSQLSLFGAAAGALNVMRQPSSRRLSNASEWSSAQRLSFEREALGFYISGHPAEQFQSELERFGTKRTVDIKRYALDMMNKSSQGPRPGKEDGGKFFRKQIEVMVGGVITSLKLKNTKKGDRYASFVLEDWLGTVETLVWPDTYKTVYQLLTSEEPVIIKGRVDVSDERCTLVADSVQLVREMRDSRASLGVLELTDKDPLEDKFSMLLRIFSAHGGQVPVKARMKVGSDEIKVVLKDQAEKPVCVAPSQVLCDEVERLFGRPVLRFV